MKNLIYIHGVIGESVSAESIINQLSHLSGPISIDIASPGGSVAEGTAIYNALMDYRGETTIDISGWALSIASFIAMAGDKVRMSDTSVLMVHKPHVFTGGNAFDLRREADVLDTAQKALVNAYTRKTGLSSERINELLDAETWLTADEALKLNFIDEIINVEQPRMAASFNLNHFKNIPNWVHQMTKTTTDQTINDAAYIEAKAELDRIDEITLAVKMASKYLEDGVASNLLIEAISDKQCTLQVVNKRILDEMSRCSPEPIGSHAFQVDGGHEDRMKNFIDAAQDALLQRNGVRVDTPHPAARDLKNMGIPEIARTMLRINRDFDAGSYSPRDAVIKAMHSTSDLPLLLANVGSKSLREGYMSAPITCREWAAEREVPDFKEQTLAMLSSAPEFLEVPAGGEYKQARSVNHPTPLKLKNGGGFSASRAKH